MSQSYAARRPERWPLLENLQRSGTAWHTTPTYQDGEALRQTTADLLLEGVVAERTDATHRPGQLSAHLRGSRSNIAGHRYREPRRFSARW